jgi:hypothetical protein
MENWIYAAGGGDWPAAVKKNISIFLLNYKNSFTFELQT